MIDEQLQEQAALYALEVLEGDELTAFEQAFAADAELQRLAEDFRAAAATLAHCAPALSPPPQLQARILSEIRPPNPRSRATVSNFVPWAMAAGLALCCGLLLLGRGRTERTLSGWQERAAAFEAQLVAVTSERDRARAAAEAQLKQFSAAQAQIARLQSERDALTRQVSELKQNESAMQVRNKLLAEKSDELEKKVAQLEQQRSLNDMRVALLSSKMQSAPRAIATVVWDAEKQEGILRTADMPPNASNKDYQLWLVDPEYQQPVDAGVFSVPTGGTAKFAFRPKAPISTAKAFAISLERKGGVPKVEGPIVLAGK
ncbi:hypothetical protein BH18VER1_BH18VER1_18350 [soil metagenome]